MAIGLLTANELIATIRNSAMPTVLVEGPTDAYVYRAVEAEAKLSFGTLLPCGGRSTLLEIYRRRDELRDRRCAFLADRDMWIFSGIPSEYTDVIFTSGYSIENDLFSDGAVERLFDEIEQRVFADLVAAVTRWFTFEAEEFLANREHRVGDHLDRLIKPGTVGLCPDWCRARGFREPDTRFCSEVRSEFRMKLRGKHLAAIYHRILHAPQRRSKYVPANLIELASKSPGNLALFALCDKVRAALAIPEGAPAG